MNRTLSLASLLLVACASGGRGPSDDPSDGADSSDADTGSVLDAGCRSTPRAADSDRIVLVSLPYNDDLSFALDWAVMRLDAAGDLVDTSTRLALGTARTGRLRFTPDGSVGITPLDDGTLGVVGVSEDSEPVVLQAGFDPGTHVSALAIDPRGESVWLVNPNWPDNGGGLWRADIDCDSGHVGAARLVIAAKNPAAIVLVDHQGSRGILVGREIPGAGSGADLALVDLDSGAVIDGSDAFGDEEAIVSDAVLSASGWLLAADHSEFSGVPNRIAAVQLDGDRFGEPVVVPDIYDPVSIVPNPSGPGALVPSGYGDQYWLLGEAPGTAEPWFIDRALAEGNQPGVELPDDAIAIDRGSLAGHVLSVEVGGIRQINLEATGSGRLGGITDFGAGYSGIPGAIGVQP
ncbi:MAG: hypothetical protein VX000_08625 [Myxococcota bacterium]|nr:hypothetical protein [Myxococcota bacterium]